MPTNEIATFQVPQNNTIPSQFCGKSSINVLLNNSSTSNFVDMNGKTFIPSIGNSISRDLILQFELENNTGNYLTLQQLENKLILSLLARSGEILNSVEINNELPSTQGVRNKYLYVDTFGQLSWRSGFDSDNTKILYDTTENWNSQIEFVSQINTLYVYIDGWIYDPTGTGQLVAAPKLKIGDGNSYLIDKPFITDYIEQQLTLHLQNTFMHLQPGERDKWNNKLNYIEPLDSGILEFTRN